MSDMPFVSPGDPLNRSAAHQNELIKAARAGRQQRIGGVPPKEPPPFSPQDVVLIVNNSGSVLRRYAVVGLVAPVFLPDASANAEYTFRQNTAFEIEWPATAATSAGRFAILQQPLAAGAVGTAILAGVAVCYLETSVDKGDAVDVGDTTDALATTSGGAATVLWCGSGTGLDEGMQWGYIRFGGGGGSGASIIGFTITEFTCDMIDDHGHPYAIANVDYVACGLGSPEVGDEVTVYDLMGCDLVGNEGALVGQKGQAFKAAHEVDDGYNSSSCSWVISKMCPGEISC